MGEKTPSAPNPLDLSKKAGTRSSTQEYRSGQTLYTQGDKAEAIFYVHSGHVKLTVTSEGGKKAVIGILRQGDVFGEGCLTHKSLRTCTASVIQLSKHHARKKG